ncbi:hypothetical protein ACFPL7_03520 [Dongia soli]|uniref:Uncharacterized protein n=1 Tax=Dongia soli TaxID=600628 RepID=A0ABU5EEX4_9PROT|nr:hypothetical protein [Dongia soli]MDY0884640.1 hypothetical protein [Dongia soli]
MFNKAKPSKQDLKKLDKGVAAAGEVIDLINGLEKAIETQIRAIEFVDGAIRRELARTQLTIGLSRAHLRQLTLAAHAYRAGLMDSAKPAKKAASKGKPAAKAKSAAKPAAKAKSKGKTKTAKKAK